MASFDPKIEPFDPGYDLSQHDSNGQHFESPMPNGPTDSIWNSTAADSNSFQQQLQDYRPFQTDFSSASEVTGVAERDVSDNWGSAASHAPRHSFDLSKSGGIWASANRYAYHHASMTAGQTPPCHPEARRSFSHFDVVRNAFGTTNDFTGRSHSGDFSYVDMSSFGVQRRKNPQPAHQLNTSRFVQPELFSHAGSISFDPRTFGTFEVPSMQQLYAAEQRLPPTFGFTLPQTDDVKPQLHSATKRQLFQQRTTSLPEESHNFSLAKPPLGNSHSLPALGEHPVGYGVMEVDGDETFKGDGESPTPSSSPSSPTPKSTGIFANCPYR